MLELRIRLKRADIAYVQFILEGYDGLGQLSTLDAHEALARLSCPADRAAEAQALLSALSDEGFIQEVIK